MRSNANSTETHKCLIVEPNDALRSEICNLLLQAGYSPVDWERCVATPISRIRPNTWLALILDWCSLTERDLDQLEHLTDAQPSLKVILTFSARQSGGSQASPPRSARTRLAVLLEENVGRDLLTLLRSP